VAPPPALPALVRPRTADRPEHIAAEDEGAEPVHRTMCVGLIDAVRAPVLTDHCLEHARPEQPLVQFPPAFAERIFKTLLRPCSETVERDRKACNAHFRHSELPFISTIYLIAGNVSDMGHQRGSGCGSAASALLPIAIKSVQVTNAVPGQKPTFAFSFDCF